MGDVVAVEYLYGIDSTVDDDSRHYESPRIVRFRIVKKTARRVYYLMDDWSLSERSRGQRFVDRETLERDGQVTRRSAGWWEPDLTVYLNPPVIETAKSPTLEELKDAMRAAHPDAGGSHEAFLAAHQRYERARAKTERETPH